MSKRPEKNTRVQELPAGISFHPLANVFPLIEGDEFEELIKDIAVNGLRHPIALLDGMIIDGRNRQRACEAAHVVPRYFKFDGADPIAFVISSNLRRRHLNTSQRALAMAQLEKIGHGGARRGDREELPVRADLAHRGHVSERSIARARIVIDQGAPELQAAVRAGQVAVSTAEALAEALDQGDQRQLMAIAAKDKLGEAAILAAAKDIKARKSEKRRAERNARIITNSDCTAESMLAGGRRYPLIYADPAWRYLMGDTDRSVENHYGTMALADICALPVRELALQDAVLFLWIPEPHLFCSGVPVLSAWDFTHKSGFIWDKVDIGMGHYNRVVHEHLLICTRGAVPEPLPAHRPRSLYSEKRTREHSEKPAHYYDLIEQMYPQFFRAGAEPLAIELFARTNLPDGRQKPVRPGWAVWGNQATSEARKDAA